MTNPFQQPIIPRTSSCMGKTWSDFSKSCLHVIHVFIHGCHGLDSCSVEMSWAQYPCHIQKIQSHSRLLVLLALLQSFSPLFFPHNVFCAQVQELWKYQLGQALMVSSLPFAFVAFCNGLHLLGVGRETSLRVESKHTIAISQNLGNS